jgi:hypothetical protein
LDPINNKNGVGIKVYLSWQGNTAATSYNVQVDDNSNFSSPNYDQENIVATRCFVTGLRYSNTYYWRVKANSSQGSNDWSDVWQFTTMAQPNIDIIYPTAYTLSYLQEGDQYYIDRELTLYTIPSMLRNFLWIMTANNDKGNTSSSLISMNLKNRAKIFIAYDARASIIPNWLVSQYARTGMFIKIQNYDGTLDSLNVWEKEFGAGSCILGGNKENNQSDAKSNYVALLDIKSNYAVSGAVKYYTSAQPIAGVNLTLAPANSTKITDGTGSYLFDNLQPGNSYSITANKLSKAGQSNTTISSQDAYLAAQTAFNLISVNADQKMAADADGDNSITMWDASLIARYSAGITVPAECKVGEWRFDPIKYEVTSLASSKTDVNFTGIVIGDVDGSWSPNGAVEALKKEEQLYADNENDSLAMIISLGSSAIQSFDITIKYDPDVITYQIYEKKGLSESYLIFNNIVLGLINISGFCYSISNISTDAEFTLHFIKKTQNQTDSHLNLQRFLLNGQYASSNNAKVLELSPKEKSPKSFELLQNFPNPFIDETQIIYFIPEKYSQQGKMQVFDINGRCIKSFNNIYANPGSQSLKWDATDQKGYKVPVGIYFLVLETNHLRRVLKMIKYK